MKTIFTYKGKRYSYKMIDNNVKTYEIMRTGDNQVNAEYEKLTDEEWKYIFQNCEELEKEK